MVVGSFPHHWVAEKSVGGVEEEGRRRFGVWGDGEKAGRRCGRRYWLSSAHG